MTVCIKGKLEGKYIPSLSNQRLPVARGTLLSSILPAPEPHQDPEDKKQKLPCCLLIVDYLSLPIAASCASHMSSYKANRTTTKPKANNDDTVKSGKP